METGFVLFVALKKHKADSVQLLQSNEIISMFGLPLGPIERRRHHRAMARQRDSAQL